MSNRILVGTLTAGVMAAASHWYVGGISRQRERAHPYPLEPVLKQVKPDRMGPRIIDIIDTHPLEGLAGSPWADERLRRFPGR